MGRTTALITKVFDGIVSMNPGSFRNKYYALGLMSQDLLRVDDHVVHKEAVDMLPPDVLAERQYRISRAVQLDMIKRQLPKEMRMTTEKDVDYLSPYIRIVEERRLREVAVLDKRYTPFNIVEAQMVDVPKISS